MPGLFNYPMLTFIKGYSGFGLTTNHYSETRIKINDVGEKVLMEIADNGIGIPSEHLPRIFERFYRVDKSRSREQGGTGLGLSIIKHILEAHKEQLQIMSTEGAGSVFTFSLKKKEVYVMRKPYTYIPYT